MQFILGCTDNFPLSETSKIHDSFTRSYNGTVLYNKQMLFPSINFTCSGYIKRWIFNGDFQGTRFSNLEFPEPQIWEPDQDNSAGGSYRLRASSGFYTIVKPIGKNDAGQVVMTPNSKFPINAGAVLGLLIRSAFSDQSVQLHFLEDPQHSDVYYYLDTPSNPNLQTSFSTSQATQEKIYIPLITIDFCKYCIITINLHISKSLWSKVLDRSTSIILQLHEIEQL